MDILKAPEKSNPNSVTVALAIVLKEKDKVEKQGVGAAQLTNQS